MPTHQDETLPQRYAREHQDYLKLCGSMTAEQVADLQLQLNNALAREQALQQRLTAADERADVSYNLLLAWYEANAKGLITVDDEAYHIVAATAEALEGGAASCNADLDQVKAMAARADVLEGLLREARQHHGVMLMSDPPQDAWKYHRINERIDAALRQAEGGGDE